MITQERVRELFTYNPETGLVYRRKQVKGNRLSLSISVGTKDKHGYLTIGIDNKRYRLHRIIYLYVYGIMPEEVDHENHIKCDNRITNLQDGTRIDNMRNCPLRCTNTSGIVGVRWIEARRRWGAYITVNYKTTNLGLFKVKEDAIKARQYAERKYNFHPNHGTL